MNKTDTSFLLLIYLYRRMIFFIAIFVTVIFSIPSIQRLQSQSDLNKLLKERKKIIVELQAIEKDKTIVDQYYQKAELMKINSINVYLLDVVVSITKDNFQFKDFIEAEYSLNQSVFLDEGSELSEVTEFDYSLSNQNLRIKYYLSSATNRKIVIKQLEDLDKIDNNLKIEIIDKTTRSDNKILKKQEMIIKKMNLLSNKYIEKRKKVDLLSGQIDMLTEINNNFIRYAAGIVCISFVTGIVLGYAIIFIYRKILFNNIFDSEEITVISYKKGFCQWIFKHNRNEGKLLNNLAAFSCDIKLIDGFNSEILKEILISYGISLVSDLNEINDDSYYLLGTQKNSERKLISFMKKLESKDKYCKGFIYIII